MSEVRTSARAAAPADVPRLGRRERARADKRERILAAARKLLREKGYERMTVALVADEADVAVGTVFQYAGSKAELLMMVVADALRVSIPSAIDSVTGRGPGRRVRQLLQPLATWAADDPTTSAAIARELLFGADGPHRGAVVELVAELEAAIARVIAGSASAQRADTAARLIVAGSILELNRTRTLRASRASVEKRLGELVEIAIAGARAGNRTT